MKLRDNIKDTKKIKKNKVYRDVFWMKNETLRV